MSPDFPEPRPKPPKEEAPQNVAPIGEAQVWLTSMGLAFGLLMSVGLITLILVRGVEVFWPKKVALVELAADSEALLGESRLLAGEIVLEREAGAVGDRHSEIQLFLGNKDAYGFAFRFLRADDITATSYPEELITAERMEYGDAIFYPGEIRTAAGTVIPATDAAFPASLRSLVDEGNERRDEIKAIEKDQIGSINRKLAALELDRKVARDSATLADIEKTIADLQSEYEALAGKAGALRQRQGEDILAYTTATGEERTQPVTDIVSFYYPNDLSFFGRIGIFLGQLWTFLSEEPREANTEGGIFPAIFGTFVMTVFMSLLVTPFGIIAAIYLREYAKQGFLVRCVRISVNNLAGVPSIVFGVFGLGFFIYFVGGWIDQSFFSAKLPAPTFGTGGIFWASLTLALLTLPVVIVATEEALGAVPRGVREAALACGASKWQTIQRIVLPSATPGILTGVILSMARGAGEVAPLMLVGVVKIAPELPINGIFPYLHPEQKFMHLGFHIYDLGFQSPDSEAAKPMVFATTFLLIVLVVVMNLTAILLRNHLRKKYALASF
jgi:phosphate transport system permease protein